MNVIKLSLVIGFFFWMFRGRGIPEGEQLDVEYSKAVDDSRQTFKHYPVWEGGLAAPEILRVANDGSFAVTQYGRVIHSGHICCIQDAGSQSDENAVARFRVDYVIYQGETSTSTVEWMCSYYPRMKLTGPSLEIWTPKEPAASQ
jgi:hypothetical protein